MITRLKKLQFLVYHRDYANFLEQLRELGVAHLSVRPVGLGENEQLDEQMQRANELAFTVQQLQALKVEEFVANQIDDRAVALANTGNVQRGIEAAERVKRINERIKEAEHRRLELSSQVEALAPWGEFDPACRDIIAGTGRTLSFHTVPSKLWNEKWAEECPVFLINEVNKVRYFVSIDEPVTDDNEVLRYAGAATVDPPHVLLSDIVAQLEDVQREIPHLYTDVQIIARQSLDDVVAAWKEAQDKVTFDSVMYATDRAADDTLMVLIGWFPASQEAEVDAFCQTTDAWYEISSPTIHDTVPTKMSNGRITRLFEGLTRMYGSPDYNEFDATPMIAIFFSIFFGFCVGDAGYGLVLLTLGFPICKFLKNSLKIDINPVLVTILGGVSTIVGLLLGTAFGADLAGATPDSWYYPYISWAQAFMITGKLPGTTYDWQMVVAIGIGVLHLGIAMFVKALGMHIRFGFKEAFIDWAWFMLYVSCVGLGLAGLLGAMAVDVCTYAIYGVVALFVVYDYFRHLSISKGASVLKVVLVDCLLWPVLMVVVDFYNMVTGLLGDVLSYIRLYALGLAGGLLGGAFNMLAFDMALEGFGPSFGWIACAFIFVGGHVLNIALSCLSAFVHPLRLTFVEYFKNSGYDGRGVMFKAFARA